LHLTNLRLYKMETDEAGKVWRKEPSFDGAFLDMHLGMNGQTMQVDNRFGGAELHLT